MLFTATSTVRESHFLFVQVEFVYCQVGDARRNSVPDLHGELSRAVKPLGPRGHFVKRDPVEGPSTFKRVSFLVELQGRRLLARDAVENVRASGEQPADSNAVTVRQGVSKRGSGARSLSDM